MTVASVRAGDAERAATWLLLREFRKATRFTRPGVDATVAVRALGRGRLGPRKALLEVEKDLLDAYQAALVERLTAAEDAAERGFGARWAETAAEAAGLWAILAPRYERARGAAAAAEATRAFAALEEAAREGELASFEAARSDVAQALDGFTAAPFTPEEQARRAAQLVRFLDLVPLEYRDGTDDGRVTIPFEIQEAIAFREGAASAFSDLEAALTERDPQGVATFERALARLETYVEDAGSGGEVVDEDEVEAAHEEASEALDGMLPEEWREDDSQSDFDLIQLTLDRMESAVGAGEYTQAEQARLEAYAFFEFGPELSLRSIAPGVVARVEGLVWFGAEGNDGLAKLIAERRPARDVHETRLALDEALEEGAGSLGEGASTATVVTNAAVIVFREGLEAVLILAAVMASLQGVARGRRRPMLFGALLALVASAITFVLAQTVLDSLAQYGEKLEAVVGLVAVAVLLVVLNWFFHRVYWTEHISKFHKRRRRLLGVAGVLGPGAGLRAARLLDGLPRGLRDRAVPPGARAQLGSDGGARGRAARQHRGGGGGRGHVRARTQAALQEDADRDRRAAHRGARGDGGQDRAHDAGRGLGADHADRRGHPLLGRSLAGGLPHRGDDGRPAARRGVRGGLLPARRAPQDEAARAPAAHPRPADGAQRRERIQWCGYPYPPPGAGC